MTYIRIAEFSSGYVQLFCLYSTHNKEREAFGASRLRSRGVNITGGNITFSSMASDIRSAQSATVRGLQAGFPSLVNHSAFHLPQKLLRHLFASGHGGLAYRRDVSKQSQQSESAHLLCLFNTTSECQGTLLLRCEPANSI